MSMPVATKTNESHLSDIRQPQQFEHLTLSEAATLLKLSRSTCYYYARSGVIPAVRIGTRLRIPKDELEAYLKRSVIKALVVSMLFLLPSVTSAQEGYATYFTVESCTREGNSGVTASGIPLYDSALICALPHRQFGKSYKVCRADDATRCTQVTHLDFGPGKGPRARGVVIDLSRAAFLALAELREGKIRVTVEPL